MFISKNTLNSILARLDALEEARFHDKDRLRNIEERQAAEEDRAAQKYGILLARIKASENGRFVYDDRTGKVLPVITGIGDAQRELAAEAIAKAGPITREEIDESRAEYEKLLHHAETAAAPKQAPKRKAEQKTDDEPALFTQAAKEKVRRFYDLNFDILNALTVSRVPGGTMVMLNRRKNGNSTACRYAEEYAPAYARFVNSMSDSGARISYILTAAADRGIISCARGRFRKAPRIYMKEEIIEVYRQAEKFISEHPEKFEEFIREGEFKPC